MPRFGKDKNARNEDLDRQAAEEVERLTRRGGMPGGGGMPGMGGPGGPQIGIPSPLERMAAEVADKPRPSQRKAQAPRRAAPQQEQGFTPLPSGGVGSSFGPGGLNPGPRMAGAAPPPPAFGGDAYDDDYGGPVSGPPVFNAEPDEDEEMSITEMALMDHAARTGFDPEDLVIRYDASTAEEMRDTAMRQFYERQQSRRPGAGTNNPFAPAGMRGGPSGAAPLRRNEDPKAAGGALAQRLANRRRREEEEARRAKAAADPAPAGPSAASSAPAAPTARDEPGPDEGALAKVLARRRRSLGIDDAEASAPDPEPETPATPGPRHARARAEASPGLRSVPLEPVVDEDAPSLEDMAAAPTRGSARKAPARAKKAPAAKKASKAAPAAKKKAPAAKKAKAAKAAPAAKKAGKAAPPPAKAAKTTKSTTAAKATKATRGKKAGSTLAKAPAGKPPATKKAGKAKTVFCIECGEKNPAIAKFCFNCGTRLAAPED